MPERAQPSCVGPRWIVGPWLVCVSLACEPVEDAPDDWDPRLAVEGPSGVQELGDREGAGESGDGAESVRVPDAGGPERPAFAPRADDLVAPVRALDDPSGHALDGFYSALAALDDPGEPRLVRVTHLGDSTIGRDGLTHEIRKRVQERFGNGGPGFLLMDRYSKNYQPKTAGLRSNGRWKDCYIAFRCQPDGHYGLGGVTVSSGGGARTIFSTHAARGREASDISHVDLWFAGQPEGGAFEVSVDEGEPQRIETAGPLLHDRWRRIEVEPGPHEILVRASGPGRVRAYGVVLENDGPGIVWDGLSMVGAFTRRLSAWDDDHVGAQVARRDPDLIVLTYGGNDLRRVVAGGLTGGVYEAEYDRVLAEVRAGKPSVACIVTSVIDHGRSGEQDVEPHHVETIVDAQARVAEKHGCAFFNTYQAMGGPNSIRRWRKANPRLAEPDLKHLNRRGRAIMGENIYRALMAGYVEYRGRAG